MNNRTLRSAIGVAFLAIALLLHSNGSFAQSCNIITTVAGNGIASFGGDGGPATNSRLNYLQGIAVDHFGNVYFADEDNLRIRKISNTGVITTVAGNGSLGYGGDGGAATAAQFSIISGLTSVTVDTFGNLFITDRNRIRKVNSAGIISTVAGDATGGSGYSGDGSAATAALLSVIGDIACDRAGNLYIAERGNNCIRKVDLSGVITTIAGNGVFGYGGDGGPATAAQLAEPSCIASDRDGNIFIADSSAARIRKISSGVITRIAGGGGLGPAEGVPATNSRLYYTTGLATDTAGDIYFAWAGIWKISSGTIHRVAGGGGTYFNGDGIAATAAAIYWNQRLAISNSGDIYFTDRSNRMVRKISGGIVTTIAGKGLAGLGDGGIATNAQVCPSGVAIDTSGNMYICDGFNHRIRKANASSDSISTIAGSGIFGIPGTGVPATTAGLNFCQDVVLDRLGNVYFTDGTFGSDYRILKISTGGVITAAVGNGSYGFSGDGGPATAASTKVVGFTIDSIGNIYTAELDRIRKINTAGIITTIAGNGTQGYSGDSGPATAAMVDAWNIRVDNHGNLFFSGAGHCVVRKINSSGIISTVAGTDTSGYSGDGGPASSAAISGMAGLAIDISGNILIADTYNNVIRKVNGTTGIINTIAGTGTRGYSGDGGAATAAKLYWPNYIAVDATGNIYVSDNGNNRIRKITSGNPIVTSISGASSLIIGSSVSLIDTTSGGAWSSSSTSIATVNSAGVVTGVSTGSVTISYSVTNSCGTTVATHSLMVTTSASCNIITTIAGTGSAGFSGDGGAATVAQINQVSNLATDSLGNVYIADQGSSRIRKISTTGIISTVAGSTYGFSGDGGPATAASLASPTGVAVDRLGNIYIADRDNSRIRKVNAAGIISTVAGSTTSGSGGDGGAATAAQLCLPRNVYVDNAGNIFICDHGNHRVRKVNTSGVIITIAGNGTCGSSGGFSGDGGPATNAALNFPSAVRADDAGNVWIADGNNNRVRKVNATGIITTVAGNGSATYSGDGGPATAAGISTIGVDIDGAGNLYISGPNVVRKVNTSGIISTYAGTGIAGFSGDGGVATAAQFNGNYGVAVNQNGDVFVADLANYRVRKITSGTPTISTISGTTTLCTGATATLTCATLGGTWSSSNTAIATVNSSGLVYGVSGGSVVISYSLTNSCGTSAVTHALTVHTSAIGGTISGVSSLCVGASSTFTDTTAGGTWSSTSSVVATVSSTGVVTGVSAGFVNIIYSVSGICGSAGTSYGVTILPAPFAGTILGTSSVCAGAPPVTLTDTVSGGSWSSSSATIATVNSSGVVTPLAAGSDTIRYSVSNSCGTAMALHAFTVNAAPDAGSITGASAVCAGASISLSSGGTSGGTWSVTNTLASVSGGAVTGNSAGLDTVRYIVANACGADTALYPVTINPLPVVGIISGLANVCVGAVITLADTVGGGAWSNSNARATVAGGLVTGVSPGLDTIIYTVAGTLCANSASRVINISTPPSVSVITGASVACVGSLVTLSDSVSGGVWTAINTHASVSGGVVTGLSAGVDTVVYTVSNPCGSTSASLPVTINAVTLPTLNIINTHDTLCAIAPVTLLANITNGGSAPLIRWSKNGVFIDTGHTFTYPPDFGDVISCRVLSNAACLSVGYADDTLVIHSYSPVAPYATIHTVHDTIAYLGEIVAFDAEETYGGSDPHYQWYLNGHAVTGATSNAYAVTVYTNDTVFCKVTSNLFCITKVLDTSNTIIIHAEYLGVEHNSGYNKLVVYPNPSEGSFFVNLLSSGNEVAAVTITNVLGQKIRQFNLVANKGVEVKMDVASGIYYLSALIDGRVVTKQIVIE